MKKIEEFLIFFCKYWHLKSLTQTKTLRNYKSGVKKGGPTLQRSSSPWLSWELYWVKSISWASGEEIVKLMVLFRLRWVRSIDLKPANFLKEVKFMNYWAATSVGFPSNQLMVLTIVIANFSSQNFRKAVNSDDAMLLIRWSVLQM